MQYFFVMTALERIRDVLFMPRPYFLLQT